MFIARAGRPGLLGTVVRTAVIAGTAQATAGAVARRQEERAEQRQLAQAAAAQPVAPPPATSVPADAAGEDLIAQLQKLATLHSAGALTDEEFAAAKANILG
jgi:hypothetical protein